MRPLVVVPTYNEVETLAEITCGALDAGERLEVLVVDDESPDGTGRLADELAEASNRVHVLHRPVKEGLGAAYRAGFLWGLDREYDALVEMDADGSHDPSDLARLLHTLGGADVAIGSRYVPGGGVVAWPWHRRLLSRGGNRYVRAVTGLPVTDATAGFRAFRRCVLEVVGVASLRSDGYAFQLETALRAWQAGFRIVEIPITFTERRAGASKMSRGVVVEAVWSVTGWGLSGPRGPARPHQASAGNPDAPVRWGGGPEKTRPLGRGPNTTR